MNGNLPKPSPNVDNYMIGKGILYIAAYSGDTIGSYVDVGNCPRFEYEMTEQSIQHASSRNRVKEEDAEIVIQNGYNLSFVLDEISIANLQKFLLGTLSGTNVIYAGQDLGKRYSLKFISNNSAGPDVKYEFWKCKLTPNGSFNLISEEYNQMSFTGKGLADRTGHATSPFFTATFATTTTTTTTSA